jgi:hypothetical protein
MRTASIGRGHRRGIQGDHMPGITHRGAEPVGEKFVACDDDARGGGDVDDSPPTGRLTVTRAIASSGGTE